MPLAQWTVGDADSVEVGNVCFKVQTQCVVGEALWCSLELAKSEPRDEAVDCIETQKPEGGEAN